LRIGGFSAQSIKQDVLVHHAFDLVNGSNAFDRKIGGFWRVIARIHGVKIALIEDQVLLLVSPAITVIKRFSQKTQNPRMPPTASYRPFGSGMSLAATPSDEYDQVGNPLDQVFGFVLCKPSKHSPDASERNASGRFITTLDSYGKCVGFLLRETTCTYASGQGVGSLLQILFCNIGRTLITQTERE
jgi:hypothetical protein